MNQLLERASKPQTVPTVERSVWNSLEVSKLIVQALIPIVLGLWTYIQTRTAGDDGRQQEYVKREVDKRYQIWSEIGPDLNAIYAYFLYVGDWESISPTDLLKKKHHVDDVIYANKAFLTEDFFQAFLKFENAGFFSYHEFLKPPTLKAVSDRPLDKKASEIAAASFAECDNGNAVYETYWTLMDAVAVEMSLPPLKRPQKHPDFPLLANKNHSPCKQ